MDRAQADILVGDLAQHMGIPALALDENGMCIVTLGEREGGAIVSLGFNADAGSIDLMTCLADVDPTFERIVEALAANLGRAGGSVLAAEPSTGAFVLQRRCSGPDLGDGGLPGALLAFVEEAKAWTHWLASIGTAQTEAVPARAQGLSA